MQTERVTFLITPERKAALASRAARQGISIGEYVRRKVEDDDPPTSDEEALLELLVGELNEALPEMHRSLDSMRQSLAESRSVIRETRAYFDAKK